MAKVHILHFVLWSMWLKKVLVPKNNFSLLFPFLHDFKTSKSLQAATYMYMYVRDFMVCIHRSSFCWILWFSAICPRSPHSHFDFEKKSMTVLRISCFWPLILTYWKDKHVHITIYGYVKQSFWCFGLWGMDFIKYFMSWLHLWQVFYHRLIVWLCTLYIVHNHV